MAHGHFTINGRRCSVPSYRLRPGDVLKVQDRSKDIAPVAAAAGNAGSRVALSWLQCDAEARSATMLARPQRAEIDTDVDEQMIIEFYSR